MLPKYVCTAVALALMTLVAAAQDTTPPPAEPTATTFFGRWAQFYREDWHGSLPASPTPARRGLPSPLDSPPFPSTDWSYGGSPVIGEPDGQSYPLMNAINGAKSRTKLYGWIEPTVNGSTSGDSNLPEANDENSNRLELNQLVLYAERLPDTVQQDHFDWGFHLTALYGADYRFTTSKGILSSQLLDHNNRYGFDPALEYLDLYFPKVAQGMNLRIGRYISIPGIEAQLAPNNYTFSHSLLYSVDPFTDTGILATVKLSNKWLAQLGISAGHDTAPWSTSDAKPSGTACLSYTTESVKDNFYLCANGINTARYAYNNIQQYDLTWYHKFSKKIHSATEAWFMYERGVPAVGGPIALETNSNGAACATGLMRCTAPEYAAVNFLQYEINPHNSITLRTDFLNDKKGQRTGYQTRYSEETLSLTHWIGSTIQFRPELRFDRAWDRQAYGNGKHQNQFTVASDLIVHF
ncbi:porin [Granulicella arctica]|uniref:porin n=1 Tax=Granulicella arctica TaxID=940613 RepID=UPI0021E02500|nr:porin [Granulicella arctica]